MKEGKCWRESQACLTLDMEIIDTFSTYFHYKIK